ncbi:MAG: Ig-like domain-containing protein [Bacteroidota bacterium]
MKTLTLLGLLLAFGLILGGCDSAMTEATCTDDPTQPRCDEAAPQIVGASATGDRFITVRFDEELDAASVLPNAFDISNGIGQPVSARLAGSSTVELETSSTLDEGTYTVRVTGVSDAAGNATAGASGSFRVESNRSQVPAVGAAYPNAGDSRIILIDAEGERFVYWNPTDGSFSQSRPVRDLENGRLPLGALGATASTPDDSETYFFAPDGTSVTVYERESAAFDEVQQFGEDDSDFGDPEIESVGAAMSSPGTSDANRIFLFDLTGNQYQSFDTENAEYSQVFNYATDFSGGGSPIPSVGAVAYNPTEGVHYLFNRAGTQYTIYDGSRGRFSAAFDLSQLGDGTLTF